MSRSATSEQLWPSHLNRSYLGNDNCSNDQSKLYDPKCPSSGYLSLYEHFSNWDRSLEGRIRFELQDRDTRKLMYTRSRMPDWGVDTWSVTTHACTATMQDAMHSVWNGAISFLRRTEPLASPGAQAIHLAYVRTFKLKAKFPAVRTACTDTVVEFGRNQLVELNFPMLPEFGMRYEYYGIDMRQESYVTQDVTATVQAKMEDDRHVGSTSGTDEDLWLAAPVALEESSNSQLGLIFLKKTDRLNGTWEAKGCTIDARWAQGYSIINYLSGSAAYDFAVDQGRELMETELFDTSWDYGSFIPPRDGTWRRIDIDPSWFMIFAPTLSDTDPQNKAPHLGNRTTLESLLNLVALPRRDTYSPSFGDYTLYTTTMMEHVVSTFVADGLSRVGSHLTHNYSAMLEPLLSSGFTAKTAKAMVRLGEPLESFQPSGLASGGGNLVPMVMLTTVNGYVLGAVGWFDYFCIAVLLLHALFALGHTIWVLWHRETSDAWDTIPELLALAECSPPPEVDALANTCAGVRKFRTMARVAWVEEVGSTGNGGSTAVVGKEQLCLRFKRDGQSRRDGVPAKVGKGYGKLPPPSSP